MATDALPTSNLADGKLERRTGGPLAQFGNGVVRLLYPLASLRLTVATFALSMVVVLVGTLAQDEMNMWDVMATYFRSWFFWLSLDVLMVRTWFATWSRPPLWMGIPFPGGATVGLLLVLNLTAAWVTKFLAPAVKQWNRAGWRSVQLWTGLAVTLLGVVFTWMVIEGGHNASGIQGEPFLAWGTFWMLIKLGMVGIVGVAVFGAVVLPKSRNLERMLLGGFTAALGLLVIWLYTFGRDVQMSDSSLRILWQLLQATMAAAVLLVGCVLVFRNKGGVALVHLGVALLMFGEWFVSFYAVEEQMTIVEGQTVNFGRDTRTVELAVVDGSLSDVDRVTVVPQAMLGAGGTISDEELPFDIEVLAYYRNAAITDARPDDPIKATAGETKGLALEEARGTAGADTDSSIDEPGAYVRLIDKRSGDDLGTYLLWTRHADGTPPFAEKVAHGGKEYQLALRYQRNYKPYSIHLIDVRKDDYIGTNTPMNYSSDIQLVDPTNNENRKIHIWMNNPLRYAGETFYQSGFHVDQRTGEEITVLQVVTNTGWMIPYVSCMIVGVGLFHHFGGKLNSFLNRRRRQGESVSQGGLSEDDGRPQPARKRKKGHSAPPAAGERPEWVSWCVPLGLVALAACYVISQARPPKASFQEFDLVAFGRLPAAYQGRVKPIDTVARNALLVMSDRESLYDAEGNKLPAVRWLLDVAVGADEDHRVFRIDNEEVLETLGLKRRKGFRYSVGEIKPKIAEFDKQLAAAMELGKKHPEKLNTYQRKLVELSNRITTYTRMRMSFDTLPFPELPSEEMIRDNPDAARELLTEFMQVRAAMPQLHEQQLQRQPPLLVPVSDAAEPGRSWVPYGAAVDKAYVNSLIGEQANPATVSLSKIFNEWRRGDPQAFNRHVAAYSDSLHAEPPEQFHSGKIGFEAFYNHFSPFNKAMFLYIAAFVLTAFGWLAWGKTLNRTAFWLLLFTFLLHTAAMAGRVYISGRPPVTNLYSSAVFVGWGCVVFGLVLEAVFRMGIGNILAASFGFVTLQIAGYLAGDGDTFTVLQAVLDTQFWLSTHVVTITLGYVATLVAGGLGILFLIKGVLTRDLSRSLELDLTRMIYGVTCFALFFSFVGTVLGGLWADDSWGRFWGWDPKENGALLIVIWNAIMLHARWGGMVRERGLAALAVGGNIVTAWSWFGVNELGIGLHSYGFTEGVLPTLGAVWLSQLAIIGLAFVPRRLWRSSVPENDRVAKEPAI